MTMDGTEVQKDALQSKSGLSSSDEPKGTSKENPTTFTKEQMDKAVLDALSLAGRDAKSLDMREQALNIKETTLTTLETERKAITDERAEIAKTLEELSSKDPAKFDIVKKDRELKDRERKLKDDITALEADKQKHGESIKLATDTLREIYIWGISAEYEGGDPVKLKDLCDTFNVTSDEQIRKAADKLWTKKAPENPPVGNQPVHVDSGGTSGGGIDLNKLSPRQLIEKGLEKQKKK